MGHGTDGLKFNTLRGANMRLSAEFKDRHGRLAHSEPDGSDWSVSEWLEAVVGELGEFANLHKKVRRGDFTMDEAKQGLADELADVVIYLDILAFRLGVNLGEAVMSKFNRVSVRVGSRVRVAADDWHLAPETDAPTPSVAPAGGTDA